MTVSSEEDKNPAYGKGLPAVWGSDPYPADAASYTSACYARMFNYQSFVADEVNDCSGLCSRAAVNNGMDPVTTVSLSPNAQGSTACGCVDSSVDVSKRAPVADSFCESDAVGNGQVGYYVRAFTLPAGLKPVRPSK